MLPSYSEVQILAMTHSPICAVCWFRAPIVRLSLLSIGRALAFFSLWFIYSTQIQIKHAMIINLIVINEANRTPTQTNFTFCFLKDHLFSLMEEQPQRWNVISVCHTCTPRIHLLLLELKGFNGIQSFIALWPWALTLCSIQTWRFQVKSWKASLV